MTKLTFLCGLKSKLASLPKSEREERLSFYNEMIDDYMEEGLSEEEAVRSIGSIDAIASDILGEHMAQASATEAEPKSGRRPWEIALLVIGSPLWLSLLVAVLALILSLFVSIWSVVLCIWAVFAALLLCGVGGVAVFGILLYSGNPAVAFALLGASIFALGLSVFAYYGAKYLTLGAWHVTRKSSKCLARVFRRKEER